jgi:hypothetical protein
MAWTFGARKAPHAQSLIFFYWQLRLLFQANTNTTACGYVRLHTVYASDGRYEETRHNGSIIERVHNLDDSTTRYQRRHTKTQVYV